MSAWHLRGSVLIACNCDWGCPCNFNARPSRGDCEGGWIWSIDEGAVDGATLDGRALAVFADWPAAIHEGGGRAVCYVDDGADDRQTAALSRVVRGEIGGPWSIFINTYELAGPHRARFDLTIDGVRSRAKVGDAVELELEPIRNPVSGAEAHPEILLPEGMVVTRSALAASKVFAVRDSVHYDHSGQYAAAGRFAYEG